jgi:hypothetical protein
MPPKIIIGVMRSGKEIKYEGEKPASLVRRPVKVSQKDFILFFTAADGLIANFIIAAVHFMMIMAVPLLMPALTFTAVFEMTAFQEDMFKKV